MTKNEILLIQDALVPKGFDVGPVDGIYGSRTRAAYRDFKKSIGLSLRADLKNSHLKKELLKDPAKSGTGHPLWLRLAATYEGLREWPGQRHNPKILEWFKKVGHAWVKNDELPWCAAFVGGVLEECGIQSAGKLQARSYLKWGRFLDNPTQGCVVVFWRGSKLGFKGHIGFVVGQTKDGDLMVLGGNQGDAVNIRRFKRDRVLGYRWPAGHSTLSAYVDNHFRLPLPIIDSKIKFSTKEN